MENVPNAASMLWNVANIVVAVEILDVVKDAIDVIFIGTSPKKKNNGC